MFQFHEVQLKEQGVDYTDFEINEFQFHEVQLKAWLDYMTNYNRC